MSHLSEFTDKLCPGAPFPKILVSLSSGEEVELGKILRPNNWKLIVIYRGAHCPLCTAYLNALEKYRHKLENIGVEIIAASADSHNQLVKHCLQLETSFPLAFGLNVEQMKMMGLYVSSPISDSETDHPFAEPGLFVVSRDGNIVLVDLSNNPISRPDIGNLVDGLGWIINSDNNYPIRGRYNLQMT